MQINPNDLPDTVKECCRTEGNLQEEPSGREGAVLFRCKVCKCRHFGMEAEPGVIGLRGARTGG